MRNKLTEIISPEKVIKPFIKAKKEALDPPSVHDSNIRKRLLAKMARMAVFQDENHR